MTTRDEMVATIAAALFEHRLTVGPDGRAQCKCGWWIAPLLDSVHRLHQAESVLAATLLATAQINAENVAESRQRLNEDWQEKYNRVTVQLEGCQAQVARLLT